MKTIVLTGGGTAGHVMPNISLLPYIQKDFDRICYIGSFNGVEKNLMEGKCEYFGVPTIKLRRSLDLRNLLIPFVLWKGVRACKKLLKQIKPNVVFSKGGFVSVPVVIAARKLKIPVVAHESDLSMGLANRIVKNKIDVLCSTFPMKNAVHTGSPIREQLFKGNAVSFFNKHNLSQNKTTILIMGGSLGARAINNAVNQCDLSNYNVIHIVGKGNLTQSKNVQIEYTNQIEDYLAAADLVISRAGSNAIFELYALQKPMLLIPLSKKASRGDQIENAQYFKQKGIAHVLNEEELTPQSLLDAIKKLELNKQVLIANMKQNPAKLDGTEKIYKKIKEFIN